MFYYSLNGQQQGPVSEDQLRQLVATNVITPETLIWKEGMADWQPLATVIPGFSSTIQCSVCKQVFPPDQTLTISGQVVCANCKPRFVQGMREGLTGPNKSLYLIALNQRRLLLCFSVLILCNLGQIGMVAVMPALTMIFSIGSLVALIFSIVYVYRTAKALGFMAILYALLMIIPCINLIVLLVVVSRATNALRQGGIKVGFFGASKETIEQLRVAS
jgi:hypothetical protein